MLITPILLLATGLYLYQLGSESFWVDELYSVYDARFVSLSPIGIIQRFFDIRPVYYIILRFWMLFGEGEAWLRIPSVLFGVGGVFLTYRLGRRIAGEGVGLTAALLLTLSPLWIHFAQMVRMYAAGAFFGVLGSLFLVNALENPSHWLLAGWALTRVLVFLTAPLNIVLLLSDVLIFGFKFRKQRSVLGIFSGWLLLTVLGCLPSAYALLAQTLPFLKEALGFKEALANSPSPDVESSGGIKEILAEAVRKFKKFSAYPFASPSKLASLFLQAYNLILIGLAGLAFFKGRSVERMGWLAAWAFIPWLVHGFVSERMFFDRYIFYTLPYLLLLLAAGFVQVWRMHRLTAAGLAVMYAIVVTAGVSHYYIVQDRQDWRSLSQVINQHEQPGDMVLISFGSEKVTEALTYYYKGNATIKLIEGICTKDTKQLPVEATSETLLQDSAHLWLVCGSGFEKDEFQASWGDRCSLDSHWQFVNEAFYRKEDFMNLFQCTPQRST